MKTSLVFLFFGAFFLWKRFLHGLSQEFTMQLHKAIHPFILHPAETVTISHSQSHGYSTPQASGA